MATYSSAGIRINSVQGAGTVPVNCYAIVTYTANNTGSATSATASFTVTYGPGQTVTSTINVTIATGVTVTYSILSGVQFQNG